MSNGISTQHPHLHQLRLTRNIQLFYHIFVDDISIAAGVEERVNISISASGDVPDPDGDDRANNLVVGHGGVG